jgi:O-antigen/teichoic acid export membrane protein
MDAGTRRAPADLHQEFSPEADVSNEGEWRASRSALLIVAILFAAAPFAVAVVRVVRTGNDARYFWVALAAFVGAGLVMSIARVRGRSRDAMLRQSVVAFLVSTLSAVAVARLLGARAAFGILAVAIVFAIFFTASQALYTLYRSPRI